MSRIIRTFALLCACALSACERSGSGEPSARAAKKAAAPTPAGATAEEVALEQRSDVVCPPRLSTPSQPAGAPALDVVGLRPGLSYDEAVNVVLCDHPLLVVTAEPQRGFRIEARGHEVRRGFSARFATPRVAKTSRDLLAEMREAQLDRSLNRTRDELEPGEVKYYVATIGVPGEERVVLAAREERFATGKHPTVDSVVGLLVAKYGPTPATAGDERRRNLTWAYDPLGRRITETSPLHGICYGSADPDASVSVKEDCGVVVSATVEGLTDNPGLAQRLQVGVVDQAGAVTAIAATEDELRQRDEARRARELKEAQQHGDQPKL